MLRPLDARLLIAGWGEAGHVGELESALAAAGDGSIRFLGPVYGEHKAALLAGGRFMALPSHSEGLPVAILEAWAAGTPALMSVHCNLAEGFAAGAAIDSGTDPEDIARSLRTAFTLPDVSYRAMSEAASALAARRFAPEVVSRAWGAIYGALMPGGAEGKTP